MMTYLVIGGVLYLLLLLFFFFKGFSDEEDCPDMFDPRCPEYWILGPGADDD